MFSAISVELLDKIIPHPWYLHVGSIYRLPLYPQLVITLTKQYAFCFQTINLEIHSSVGDNLY